MADTRNLQNYQNKVIIVDQDIQKKFSFEYGDVKMITNYDAILQSIRNILNTRKGELVGLCDFGCSLQDFLFEQMTPGNIEGLKTNVINDIERFENRVEIVDFKYAINSPVIGSLSLDMVFRIKAMGNQFFREEFLLNNSSERK